MRFIQEGWTIRPDMTSLDEFDLISSDDEEEEEDVIVPASISNDYLKVCCINVDYKLFISYYLYS
jgi:hypothetical protein